MLTGDVTVGAPPSGRQRQESLEPAPLGRRALARVVDFVLGLVCFIILVFVVAPLAGRPEDGTGVLLVAVVVTFITYFVYEVTLVAIRGQTLGKRLMGLRVVQAGNGDRPGWRRALIRNLLPTMLLVVFFPLYPLPYLAAVIPRDHRGVVDRLAGTVVVSRKERPSVVAD